MVAHTQLASSQQRILDTTRLQLVRAMPLRSGDVRGEGGSGASGGVSDGEAKQLSGHMGYGRGRGEGEMDAAGARVAGDSFPSKVVCY